MDMGEAGDEVRTSAERTPQGLSKGSLTLKYLFVFMRLR